MSEDTLNAHLRAVSVKRRDGGKVVLDDERSVSVWPATESSGREMFVIEFENMGDKTRICISEEAAQAMIRVLKKLGCAPKFQCFTFNLESDGNGKWVKA